MNDEEDLATLIYKTSKTARARATAADKEKGRTNAPSADRRTSTRKRSFANQDEGVSTDRPGEKRTAKRVRKICSVDDAQISLRKEKCARDMERSLCKAWSREETMQQ